MSKLTFLRVTSVIIDARGFMPAMCRELHQILACVVICRLNIKLVSGSCKQVTCLEMLAVVERVLTTTERRIQLVESFHKQT